jgi:lipopolysaccharide export system permease protein
VSFPCRHFHHSGAFSGKEPDLSILSRYIAAAWLRLFALCQASFLAIYLVIDMMERFPRFLRAGGEPADILSYFFFKLPEMVGQTATFSVLMATLLTLGLLSRNSEVVAMRSCGVSLLRISMPMLSMSLVFCLLLLLNAEMVVPQSSEKMDQVERVKIRKQGSNAVFKLNNIWFRSDDRILQAQLFEPETRTLKGVTVWTLDSAMNPVSRIDAETAVYDDGRWLLKDVSVKSFAGGVNFTAKKQRTMEMVLKLKVDDLRELGKNYDNLSFITLRDYAESLQRGGYQAYRYLTMMHSKLSAPFAAFVMVILGIPFALRNSRSGGIAMGIGASVAIGFAFFVVNAVLLSYGRSGVLPPLLAAWGANFIFVLGGIWLAMTVKD